MNPVERIQRRVVASKNLPAKTLIAAVAGIKLEALHSICNVSVPKSGFFGRGRLSTYTEPIDNNAVSAFRSKTKTHAF